MRERRKNSTPAAASRIRVEIGVKEHFALYPSKHALDAPGLGNRVNPPSMRRIIAIVNNADAVFSASIFFLLSGILLLFL
jgi:hypothetical protein